MLPFKQSALLSLISLSIVQAQATVVRSDIDYQIFRDLAENKGQFTVGAQNISISDKNGTVLGQVFTEAPVVNFDAIERRKGSTTLIAPQYAVSVQHNDGNRDRHWHMQFGGQGWHTDAHHYNYAFVDKNNYAENTEAHTGERSGLSDDYQTPRLSKLVTEVVPQEVAQNVSYNIQDYTTDQRYSDFVRVGSGRQYIRTPEGVTTELRRAYHYMMAGKPLQFKIIYRNGSIDSGGNRAVDVNGQPIDHVYEHPLSNYNASGDSGSPYYAYDKNLKRWVLMAVHVAGTQDKTNLEGASSAILIRPHFHNNIFAQDDIAVQVSAGEQFNWSSTNGVPISSLTSQNQSITTNVTSASLTDSVSVTGFSRLKEALNDGKTIHFTGDQGILNLQNSVNQGAGALYFNNNFTVQSVNNTDTWLGAGVSVADGKTVDWQVHNPENDRLSKIGQGTLLVNGTGVNQGDISVGDGTVILSQNADRQNQVQAFNQVGIVSGRGTVVLGDSRQVDPNNIYFGYRGGRLDVNGNNLTFNYIQNIDDGAQIVNHNRSQSANITITGKTYTDVTRTTSIVANGTSYYRSRGSANMDYPTAGHSNLDWVYLSSLRSGMNPAFEEFNQQLRAQSLLSFFNGVLGETDNTRHNGELNVTYQPTGDAKQNKAKLILTGGSNLTGNLTTVDGDLILSGRPTPRAINFANGTENTRDDDWINRTFNATNIQAQGTSNLHIGRNVNAVNANITLSNQSNATLGYINGVTPVCVRSDYHGEGECLTPTYDNQSVLNNIPRTKINGNLTINDTAHMTIGKADVTAKTTASATSQMNISKDGHLILTDDSQIGHLNMTNGSQLTLNATPNKDAVEKYNKLTILGNLNGQGRFNYLTHLTQFKGDKIEVMGVAQGDYSLSVQNTGTQPTLSKEHLTLLNLTNHSQNLQNINVTLANDNQAVDLGAYRYTLRNDSGHYYLYSAGLEQYLDEEARRKAAEEEAKRQEEARRKAAEEEAKRQEEARRKAAEEEAKRQEEARRKAAEEEAKRQEEARRKAAEEEAKRQEEARRKAAEEEAKRQEEARRKAAEEEAKRQEEARRKAAEEEAKRQEETRRKAAEEEAKRQEEARRKAAEEEAKRQEEARRKAAEEEAKRQEETRRKAAEEEAKRQEEARRKAAEEEAKRQEEARRKAAEEEAKRQEEARRKAAEEEAKRQEEARRKAAEEEAKRQEEARRKAAEEEAKRQEEARRKAAEEEAKRQEEARRKAAEEEAKRQEEARRKAAEEEAKRQEEARRKAAEEEAKRQEEARRKAAEEEAKRQEEARRKAAEEEAKRQEEARRKAAEEEAKRQEEARRKAAEEEAKRQEEARRKAAEEEAKRQEEARRKAAEEEAKRQEEARRKAAEEEAKRQEEARRKAAEEEAKRQEEARRKAAEEEAKRQEEARRKAAEEEAKRQEEERRKATQAKVISRYTNTALSDLSSQMNSVVHLSNGLNRHLLGTKNSGMWINADRYSETSHRSDNYREYKKHETLTQIGADTQIDVQDGTLMLGAAWSYSQVDNTFDDAIKGDSDLNMASIYSKLTFNDDSFITADVGYGSANNEINSAGEEVKFKRNVATAGVNIGKKFTTPIIDVQPSVGVRYHYLSDSEYTLNGAKIQIDDTNLVSYRAGVSLEKTIPLTNGIMITPSISSHYVDANRDKATVIVNDIHQFQQEFGRYGQHEIGVSVSGAKWETAVTATHSEGSEVNKQQSFGIKFRYQW